MDTKTLYPILYRFTNQDGKYPQLSGILYEDGYLTASSAFVLAHVHYEDYDFDYEGISIDKENRIVNQKFPNFKHLLDITGMDELRDDYVVKVKYCLHNIPTGSRDENDFVILTVEGFNLHSFELSLAFELFESLGELPSMHFGMSLRPVVMQSQSCTVVIRPEIKNLKPNDLLFTVEQAVKINLPRLLFNDYKAQK